MPATAEITSVRGETHLIRYFAHTGSKPDQSDWQELQTHLRAVAEHAAALAEAACPQDASLKSAAYAAGLLHDLGKYRDGFQKKLIFESRKQVPPVPREQTFHKQAGAAKAAFAGHRPVAFAIAGHHGGVPNKADLLSLVKSEGGKPVTEAVWPTAEAELPELTNMSLSSPALRDNLHVDLFTRLVFSCLVDADWANTSAHERVVNDLPPEPAPPVLEPQLLFDRLQAYIQGRAAACRDPKVASARADVLAACLDAAEWPVGLLSLTVPTGGAKTLSSLALALKHSARHGLRRVIYVAPYLSILDQNADVIREALGFSPDTSVVLEHHSLAEPPGDENQEDTVRETAARRAENWDAPLVITTSVQFFESLFSNMPSRCRKLHNIARSVVVLDECQSLPPRLVAPTCAMVKQLVEEMNCTVVLCTATQPDFDHDDLNDQERLQAAEIIPPKLDLFNRLKRVELSWPAGTNETMNWQEVVQAMLAGRESERPAALCVVNTRRAARELFAELRQHTSEGLFHLSTSMCPAHRLAILDRVRRRLNEHRPCYLVSTQLIEAGVDVDFPFVMRELAPLESVIQAAGRCNREGLLNGQDGSPGGRVVVFRSQASVDEPKKYFPPDAWYQNGRTTLEANFLKAGRPPRIDAPEDIREYFMRLYRSGNLDQNGIQDHRRNLEFETVARAYRLIENDGSPVVIATWNEQQDTIDALLDRVRRDPSRMNFRRLIPFQVNLRRYELAKASDFVARLDERLDLLAWYGEYDSDLGLSHENADMLLVV
jgi:CRISPR-associated endonuclease/helicase Cas3